MRPREKFWFWRELVYTNFSRALNYALILLVVVKVLVRRGVSILVIILAVPRLFPSLGTL